ncbi:hypothetical protein FZEAL_2920 [Fusarium zealandicum]|uniref:Guanine nucleotide exchange factor synembryn n=1 Tax=Fusarium zealandicum TaxID=1053134 RepID=A0A8H4UPU6_9HYPO|nr:hypothetical protein FZEAL_2920 [Fusarium zealandicum]
MSRPLGTATGPDKLKAVTELVDSLSADLDKIILLPPGMYLTDRDLALEELKIYGRNPENADPIFTEKVSKARSLGYALGITMLLRHAFHSPSSKTARAALRVLANAMLLNADCRQIFVDKEFAPRACNELKKENYDDEFLVSRVLFLLTYGTNVDLEDLIDKHHLAERIIEKLARHAKELSNKSKAKVDPMQDAALIETLKLLFNVTHYCPDHISAFTPAVPHIIPLLLKKDIPRPKPLDPPMGPLINALLNLDLTTDKSKAAMYPKGPTFFSARLIDLLTPAIKAYSDNELDAVVTPLISVIRKVYEDAPEEIKQHFRNSLLPTADDRANVLGKGDTVSASLLKNSTNPTAPALREAISHLLFDMSDRDASKFVENVGYGFASGFLFQNNVPIPASASEAFSTSDPSGLQKHVNPITGQFIDAEKPVEEPEMTEDEKLREAERLFVLFERLKKTGIVDVQNPVEAAMREGRFRELKDDEVEELE